MKDLRGTVILAVDKKTIEDALKRKRWTMKTLAEETGLAYNTVHSFVTGKTVRYDGKAIGVILHTLGLQPGNVFKLDYGDHRTLGQDKGFP